MKNLERLARQGATVSIPTDAKGLVGRQCPEAPCDGYFKVKFGTGLKGENPCVCAYCGHKADHSTFMTAEQKEYVHSYAANLFTGAVLKDMRDAFPNRSYGGGAFRITTSISGRPHPIRHYRERDLETDVTCSSCTLVYSVFGVFAFCPDCGEHNSVDILESNLLLIEKMLTLASTTAGELAKRLVDNALEDAVSAFDGFGRAICDVHASKASAPASAKEISFQNIVKADAKVQTLFNVSLRSAVTPGEWSATTTAFQKRHLLAHSMGIVDDKYLAATGDVTAIKGRKIAIAAEEVTALVAALRKLAMHLRSGLR